MEVLSLFAPFGPEWLGGVLLGLIAFYFGRQFLDEYKKQNERKGALDLKREERKRDELNERAQRDRERSEMEGRIAAQMERSNNISEGLQAAMESLRASTAALHDEIRESREHSHDMANKVDHIYDRVDLIYEKEN